MLSRPGQPVGRTVPPGIDIQKFMEGHNFIDVPGMLFRIMKSELTILQFKAFVDISGCEITGHNAGALKKVLDAAEQNRTATFLSLNDGRAYAEWLSKMTERRFRVPTEQEWSDATMRVRDKLSGDNWEWTDTPFIGNYFFIRCRGYENRGNHHEEVRYNPYSVRLIEEVK